MNDGESVVAASSEFPNEVFSIADLDMDGNLTSSEFDYIKNYPHEGGCMDSDATNYNSMAEVDDGSCEYPVEGCTNLTANNFNQNATVDDGSCNFDPSEQDPIEGCTNSTANNFNQNATVDNGSCTFDPPEPIEGCTNSTANNYNQNATVDDGSCIFDPPEPVVIVWSNNTVHTISANKTATIQLIENDPNFTIVSIEPSLPDGLTFDTNGNISGTPTTRSVWSSYEITVNTTSDNFTTNISLAVHDLDADWRDITTDVGTINYGGLHSLILPLGEWAFPIAVDSGNRPLFSAAHSGFGRIIGYGHESPVANQDGGNETQLSLNAIEWVCSGTGKWVALESSFNHFEDELKAEGYSVTTSATIDDLNNVDCFVTKFTNLYNDTENSIIENFLISGGGLIMGGNPDWSYSDVANNANNYPGNKILRTTGLFVTRLGFPLYGMGVNVDLDTEAPSPFYRTLTAVDAIEKHITNIITLSDSEQSIASTAISLATDNLPIDFDIIWIPLRELSDGVGWLEINSSNIFNLGADPIDDSLLNLQQVLLTKLPADELIAHPSSSDFSGAVPASAPRVARTISIDGNYEGLPSDFKFSQASADGRMSTGLYAAPGEVVTVTFPDNIVDTGVNVLIGAHTDSLWDKDTISRHPIIYRVWSVSNQTIEVGNAWGGSIYIRIPAGSSLGIFDVTIEQAVEAPHYVHGVTDVSDWQDTIRHLPAPWAEIESDQFILTVPSSEIRELDDPDYTMNFWDEALQMEHNLSGFTPWPRVERAVFDIQISGGTMHSGYPFMAHLPSVPAVVNGTQMYESGDWGMFHELGHNHQWSASTLPGTQETTCNLFSAKLMTDLVGIDLAEGHSKLSPSKRESRTEDYFDAGSDIDQWSVWVAFETYLQVQEYFGWEPITEALAAYYDMEDPPGGSSAQFNRWVLELSEATNHNLAPFHEAWGFPLTPETKDALLHLPVWVDDPLRGWVYEYNPIFRNLSAENITSSSADLEWDVYDNGTNTMISVCWGVTDGGADRDLWYSCAEVDSSYVGHWSYGIDSLASGTTYYFRVVGQNNNGDTWSEVASFTTS
jgi:hypothetical protein